MNVRQLAKLCGVSRSTVSLALRDSPLIAAATRARIRQLAARLGYHPDPAIALQMARIARRSGAATGETIALLSPWPEDRAWRSNWILEQFHDGIIEQATELGYRVEEFWLRAPGMNGARLRQIFEFRGIRGVVGLNHPDSAGGRLIDFSGMAAVVLGRTLAEPGVPAVDHDHFGGMRLALAQLTARGYQRIGLALFDDWEERARTCHQWEAAFALHQQSIPAGNRVPVFVGLKNQTGRLAAWFQRHRPDAVVSAHHWGRALLPEARSAAARDAGFACLMWRQASDACAGVDMHCTAAGRIAAAMVHARLTAQSTPALPPLQTTLVAGVWRDGPSLAAPVI
jgi:DNA-binding LacI/PurR family transcriptional regulator